MEIIESEGQKKKKEWKKANRPEETRETPWSSRAYTVWKMQKGRGAEKLSEELMAKNFLNLIKYMNLRTQETKKLQAG